MEERPKRERKPKVLYQPESPLPKKQRKAVDVARTANDKAKSKKTNRNKCGERVMELISNLRKCIMGIIIPE